MKIFFCFMLAYFSSVRCDDSSNYYIVEKPDDPPADKSFKVYWNVPTMQCTSKKIYFKDLFKKYGIIQNKDDHFIGDKITILYDPGRFPAIFKNESNGKYKFRNGGVPQEGDLQEHLLAFRKDIDEFIPDTNFSGIGIIDFESWRPVFRQNFGKLVPYKDVSYEIEKKLHPWWPKGWVESEAKRRFEEAGRKFMQTTISVAKQMRPKARWGYYAFPYCFNMAQNNMVEKCPSQVTKENDQTYWLWSESTVLLPSIYREHDLTASQLTAMVRGRVEEAARVMRHNTPILPYFWYKYRDGGFITPSDVAVIFKTLFKSDASGFLIWGSSNDVDTVEKCEKLLNYVEKILGPAIASYTKKSNKQDDETVTTSGLDNVSELNNSTEHSDIVSQTENSILSNVDESALNNTVQDVIRPETIDSEKQSTYFPQNVNDIFKTWDIDKESKKNSYNQMDLRDEERINESIIFNILKRLVNIGSNINRTYSQENTIENNISPSTLHTTTDESRIESPIVKSVIAIDSPTTAIFYAKTTNSDVSGQFNSNENSSESYVRILNKNEYLNPSIKTSEIFPKLNYSDISQDITNYTFVTEETVQENETLTFIDNLNSNNGSLLAKRVTTIENPSSTTEIYTKTTNSDKSAQYHSNETSSESNVILNLYEYLSTSVETTENFLKLNYSDITSQEISTKNNDVTRESVQENITFTGIDDINTNNEYLIFVDNDKPVKPQQRQSNLNTNTEAPIDMTTENEYNTESERFTSKLQY